MAKKKKQIRNISDEKATRVPHTRKEIVRDAVSRASRVGRELARGLEFVEPYQKSVTFFGSARFGQNNPHYKAARRLAKRLSEAGFTVTTGGGPGIMEAGNRGAHDAGGPSLGLTIKLPQEELSNPYVSKSTNFYYFFTRKVALSFAAEAYIYFPGGFGTLDELLEILTLVQTHKIARVPIILMGSDFWKPFDVFVKKNLVGGHKTIGVKDTKLYHITDDEDEIVRIVKRAPLRDG